MSHRLKSNEPFTCEKYLSKLMKQDSVIASKKITPRYNEKFSTLNRQTISMPAPRIKPKPNLPQKTTNNDTKLKPRSASKNRQENEKKAPWGQLLLNNKSKDKVSNFSNFDPLRTLHFLSKELHSKIQSKVPDEQDLIQMVADIQHALKRIPPEITTLLHSPDKIEKATKLCQTPPTLYQEDTEKFQKIMEENTYKLEAGCKQLELVCSNLQNEKDLIEQELEEAKSNIEFLCRRIKELEDEKEDLTTILKNTEDEKLHLEAKLNRTVEDLNNPSMHHLKKLVDELKKQKLQSEENCARLEYDMALLKMEKEKFVTMLAVRDREIKDIQEEMKKIQEQVAKELKKLNCDIMKRSNSMKTLSEPFIASRSNLFLEIGDTTISSIETNDSDKNIIKESPCGDAEVINQKSEEFKLKANKVETDLVANKEEMFEDLLSTMTPSFQSLLASNK